VCSDQGVDGGAVMRVFCGDTKLNISARYLRPGFAFGGSCLPKDLRALLYMARHRDLNVPVLESVLPSNHLQIQQAFEMVQRAGKHRVAIIGLSFKPNTDDLRESPVVILAENLIGKGYQVRIFDQNVNLSQLMGGNRAYIEQSIPHISALTCATLNEALNDAGTVIATHGVTEHLRDQLVPGQTLIDLSRMVMESLGEIEAIHG
jgi:GDP-mannose 6-dehydrogenase